MDNMQGRETLRVRGVTAYMKHAYVQCQAVQHRSGQHDGMQMTVGLRKQQLTASRTSAS